nr:hypothetical protein [Fodinicola feengrottensis]
MFSLATRIPLTNPITPPPTIATRIATGNGQPCVTANPSRAADHGRLAPIDRSMPATVTTNCCPIASTIRIDADTSRSLMFETVRKSGVAIKKIRKTITSPMGAA